MASPDRSAARTCPTCGGPLVTENFAEATITRGECGYSWAAHFGGGEVQKNPCLRGVPIGAAIREASLRGTQGPEARSRQAAAPGDPRTAARRAS